MGSIKITDWCVVEHVEISHPCRPEGLDQFNDSIFYDKSQDLAEVICIE